MELDTPYIHLVEQDKILIGTYAKGIRINLDMAKEIVRVRLSFTGNTKMAAIIRSQGVVSIDKASREYLASAEATRGLLATAIIVQSSFSSFLGNFFLLVNSTNMPVRIFTSEEKAKKWLRQFVE